ASNQAMFLEQVEQESGLQMRVLEAEQEAYYGYLGTVNSLALDDAYLIDIGGGSTQVTAIRGRGFQQAFSRPLGALRISDRHITSDPISGKEFRAIEQAAAETFADLNWFHEARNTTLAGIGGTIRTLAEIDMKMRGYSLDRVHGYQLRRDRLEALVEQLRGTTLKQREDMPGLGSDRADLILGGAVILRQLMRQGDFSEITVSGYGLREGLFFEQFLAGEDSPLIGDLRGFSVQNLARNYGYEAVHCAKVQELSLSLFDQLASLHGLGEWERELLGYAAVIHDIGVAISYYDHHKHGAYLILNSALLGFSHREVVLLAALVRAHRKGDIDVSANPDIVEDGDAARMAKLAALLRIAEYLERRKSQVVQGLTVEIGETVRVVCSTTGDASIEIWDANRRSSLFKKAYGRPIEIV
ncbi:MAG: Ppx/GppA family phosphatase, partial [Roseiflexaceae bacterium]|nr:Ppx/GppA family phosphatase [Roseiflexaceae bacterium]